MLSVGMDGVAGKLRSRLLVIDTETGGLDAGRDALLSVGMADSLSGQLWGALVRPAAGLEIGEEALGVNGLSRSLLEEDGFAESDVVGMVARVGRLCRGAVLAGCNVGFDVAFLRAAFERCGVSWPFSHRMVDLQSLAWVAWEIGAIWLPVGKSGGPSLSLDSIAGAVGMGRAGGTHSAMEDAGLTLRAIVAVVDRIRERRAAL